MSTVLPKKGLGQHWLHDPDVLRSIAETAEISVSDHVLEIGPGLGTLTEMLLIYGSPVTAVEVDKELFDRLKSMSDKYNHQHKASLQLVHEDILKFDLSSLPRGYKVVANIPYYLTSNLIRILSESLNPPRTITLLVQKEVAERLAATPGAMSILAVSAQAYYEVGTGLVVPADKFTPPPKVDSQVVHMIRRAKPVYDPLDKKIFFRVVKAGFSARRKTLLNSLSGGLTISKDEINSILNNCDIPASARPQELTLQQWSNLANAVRLGL